MSKIDFKDNNMHFINCNIPFPTENGLHIVSSGCGSGKTTMIQKIIEEKWKEGILVVTATINMADEINKRLEAWKDGIHTFDRCNLKVLHSGDNRITEMEDYKSNPLSLANTDVLVITSARLIIDPYELFLSYHKGKTRGLILIDEMINFYPQPFDIPIGIRNVLTFIDKCKTHNGKTGTMFKDDSGSIWYQHCYQNINIMKAAYMKSGYELFKVKNKLNQYKTEYIFKHIIQNGMTSILGKLKDFADQSCAILFDGTSDCIFNKSDPRLLPISGKRYESDIQFIQFNMPFKRKNKEEWTKDILMSVGKSVLDMLRECCSLEKTLIVTWKSIDVFKSIKNEGNADYYEREREDKIQYNFPKLLYECLVQSGVNSDNFSIIYRGSGLDRGSNEYMNYQNIVFLGEWHIPDNIVGEINKMFGCKCKFKDYMKSLVIQTICRIRIRKHLGLPVKVYFSSDIDYNLIADVQEYFIKNSPVNCKIEGIKKPCRKYSKPDKKKMMDMVLLYSYDFNIRNSIENETSYSFNITLDELYKTIPRTRKAKDKYKDFIGFLKNRNIYMTIT